MCDQVIQLPTILDPSRSRPCSQQADYYVLIPGVCRSNCCGRHLEATLDTALQLAAEMGERALALVTRDGQ
jgi:hypothetical protein